jgi:NADH:ubiquinone oxidoreductase subunit 6 (subunit J)
MIKGPLVYAAVILAALLMVISAVVILNRDLFLENSELIMIVSGVVAIGVIIVLVLMFLRIRKHDA